MNLLAKTLTVISIKICFVEKYAYICMIKLKMFVNMTHKSMYRRIINAAFFLSLSIAVGCTNSKYAERISELEQRLQASEKERKANTKRLKQMRAENPPKAKALLM